MVGALSLADGDLADAYDFSISSCRPETRAGSFEVTTRPRRPVLHRKTAGKARATAGRQWAVALLVRLRPPPGRTGWRPLPRSRTRVLPLVSHPGSKAVPGVPSDWKAVHVLPDDKRQAVPRGRHRDSRPWATPRCFSPGRSRGRTRPGPTAVRARPSRRALGGPVPGSASAGRRRRRLNGTHAGRPWAVRGRPTTTDNDRRRPRPGSTVAGCDPSSHPATGKVQ